MSSPSRNAVPSASTLHKPEHARWKATLLAALFVAAITFAAFPRALTAGFINLDDDLYVSANEHVQKGLTGPEIGWAWSSNYLGYEIPLTWMSYMLDTDLFGKGPWGYHLTNVILHAANAVLLLLVLNRATNSLWRAALAAALWAVHPLRVESVAWVTERKDVLAGFFAMATLYAYVRHAQAPGRGWFAAVLAGYCLSLLSKPPLAAALPVSLWLLDYWPLGRMAGGPGPDWGDRLPASRADLRRQGRKSIDSLESHRRSAWRLAVEKWPLVAVAIVAGGVLAAGMSREAHFEGDVVVSWPSRLANAVVAPVRSLERQVWFKHLAVVYPMPAGWPATLIIPAAALLLAVTGFVVWQRKRFPWLLVGWFWFAVNFAPSVGLVQSGLKVAMGDRYAYFPAIGLVLMLVWSIPQSWVKTVSRRAILGTVSAGCLFALIASTWTQLSYWQDSISIFRHAVAVTKDNWMAHHDLAVALSEKGENEQALQHFNQSIRINSNYPFAWENRGRLLFTMGDYPRSLADADRAVALEPASVKAHWVREYALMKLGRFEDAAQECGAILRLDPKSADARSDIAIAFSKRGKDPLALIKSRRYQEAIRACEQVLALDPQSADAHNEMAFALMNLGRRDEAISQLQEALKLDPSNSAVRDNLARLLNEAQHHPATAPAEAPPRLGP
jgi:tetratricopeptide (TPR) repeat protein